THTAADEWLNHPRLTERKEPDHGHDGHDAETQDLSSRLAVRGKSIVTEDVGAAVKAGADAKFEVIARLQIPLAEELPRLEPGDVEDELRIDDQIGGDGVGSIPRVEAARKEHAAAEV